MLLRSKLFLLSPAPNPSNARGRGPKYYDGVMKVLGVNAASQQTLFIVSGSPPNPILRGGNQNALAGFKVCSANTAYSMIEVCVYHHLQLRIPSIQC